MELFQNILIILVIAGLVAFFALNQKKRKVIDRLPEKEPYDTTDYDTGLLSGAPGSYDYSDTHTDPKKTTLDLEFWRAEHAKEYGPYNSDNLAPLDSELETYARQRIAGGYIRP